MKASQNLCILFWLNTPKIHNGKAPIYVRLTIDGSRTQFSLGKKIEPEKWISKAGIVKGTNEEARTLNNYINLVKGELQKHYNILVTQHHRVLPEMLRNAYIGVKEEKNTLLQIIDFHNLKFKEKADIGQFSLKTFEKYLTTRLRVSEFLSFQYKLSDLPLADLKYSFITNFEHFLVVHKKMQNNSAMKHIKNIKKILRLAVSMEWLSTNPFDNFKCSYKHPDIQVLSQENLQTLYEKQIFIKRLDEVRDVFLFCCYTGFAYSDVASFTNDIVQIGLDGEKWLSINRQKTKVMESVMLLPIPLEIIEKYKEHPYCKIHNKLLPVNSNQKYNAYLKELADICGIKMNLTTHIARHTFATTVTLANDVPMETVSALLGHKSLKTTQIYAKVVKKKVSNDMKALREKLNKSEELKLINVS
ncbi:site-specific integrase [Emticicia sp. SJ17W-69]|uniref:site-specific integrase n=1 Tax=Emticicia sp. SJ17W-69 TaxID=3421657 RepID=UPI003EB8AC3B